MKDLVNMTDYSIQFANEYDDKLLEELVVLMKDSFPDCPFGKDYYHWQYVDNPNGRVVSYNAYYEGSLVAHYAAIPIEMSFDGIIHRGLLSLNTATHSAHRGKGLFVKLAQMTYDHAKEMSYKYVIGVANANSTHGFLTKLGFYQICPLEVRFGVGDIFSHKVEKPIHVEWNDKTLQWRLANPYYKYRIGSNMIFGSMDKPLFKTIVSENNNLEKKGSIGLRPFNLYVGLGLERKGGLYFRMPSFIKHSPFNLIFKDMSDGELPQVTQDNIFFQLIDYDVA